MSEKDKLQRKHLRAIGQKLKPIVTVAGNGLSENVMLELERALGEHELIKVKLAVGSRDARSSTIDEICHLTGAQTVQTIGNVVVLLRRSPKPDPRLSNLIRTL